MIPKLRICTFICTSGRRAFRTRSEAKGVTHRGAYGSENAGASNRNASEILARRNPKVSLAMMISQGLVGPKGIPNGGPDGQMVNIPSPRYSAMEGRRVVC